MAHLALITEFGWWWWGKGGGSYYNGNVPGLLRFYLNVHFFRIGRLNIFRYILTRKEKRKNRQVIQMRVKMRQDFFWQVYTYNSVNKKDSLVKLLLSSKDTEIITLRGFDVSNIILHVQSWGNGGKRICCGTLFKCRFTLIRFWHSLIPHMYFSFEEFSKLCLATLWRRIVITCGRYSLNSYSPQQHTLPSPQERL